MIPRFILIFILTLSNIWLASAFEASYYSDAFEWATSSNGTIFSQSQHTAAICYEELSQLAYISTAQTGMVVTLTDRPNCNRHDNRIDLTSSVFSVFVPLSKWLIKEISAVPLGIKTGNFVKRDLSQKDFSTLSIELTRPIANTYIAWESVSIAGKVTTGQRYINTYFKDRKTGAKYEKTYSTDSRWNFDIVVSFPDQVGEYSFGIIPPGLSFYTEDLPSILVVSRKILSDIIVSWEWRPQKSTAPLKLKSNSTIPTIALSGNMWGLFSLENAGRSFDFYGKTLPLDGTWLKRGYARFSLSQYRLSTASSLDRSPQAVLFSSWNVLLDRVRETIGVDKLSLRTTQQLASFRFLLPAGEKVSSTYYVTLPDGDVREYDMPSKYDSGDWFLKTWVSITGSFPIALPWVYRFELVKHTGIAYVNIPVYQWQTLSIVPVLTDAEIRNIKTWASIVKDSSYMSINAIRTWLKRGSLARDADLDRLAQKKADYMAQSKDFWHITKDGRGIQDFAKALGITRYTKIAENIAWWMNTGGIALQDGLEESGSHRHAMVSPDYTKVWIGYAVIGESTYLVQVFSN